MNKVLFKNKIYLLLAHFFCNITTYAFRRTILDAQNYNIAQILFFGPLLPSLVFVGILSLLLQLEKNPLDILREKMGY